jgi:hypothetical protein
MRFRACLAVALLALAAAGCGADDDTASSVAQRFVAAAQGGDGDTACAQLTPDTRAALEDEEQRECRVAVTDLKLEPGSVSAVRVYVTNAVVELSSGEAEFLEKGAEGWRLSAVGCTPAKGRPKDQPYDCELED